MFSGDRESALETNRLTDKKVLNIFTIAKCLNYRKRNDFAVDEK